MEPVACFAANFSTNLSKTNAFSATLLLQKHSIMHAPIGGLPPTSARGRPFLLCSLPLLPRLPEN